MKIRSAKIQDAAEVRKLIFDILHEHGLKPDPQSTDSDLDDIESFYLKTGGIFDVVLDEGEQIIGTLGLLALGDICELRKMYLHKKSRGQGLGRKLLEHAIQRARELGFHKIELETASVLKDAIRMYERYGFKPIEREHLPARCDQAYQLILRA